MSKVGDEIDGFLNGIITPLTSGANTLIGQTSTSTTTGEDPNQTNNKKTAFYIIGAIGIAVILVVGIVIFKSNKSA